MRFTHLSWVLLFLLLGAAFAQTHPDDNRNLGDVARETREEKRLKAQDASPHAAHMRELIADMSVNDPEEYAGQMTRAADKETKYRDRISQVLTSVKR
jgi:hypothetical protein